MKNFIVYNQKGKILRTGSCAENDFCLQVEESEFVMEGTANDITQKVEFDGLDVDGQPVNPRVVNKTPEEIEAEKPPEPVPVPFEKLMAHITNEQWQAIQDRFHALEKK